jgi:hypothetical protein
MNNKLDKLKEVNMQVNNIIKEMEIRIFIENIEDVRERVAKPEKPKVAVELK